ncbi:MAG: RNA polymerase sigma factor [Bacteroidota bacterium]
MKQLIAKAQMGCPRARTQLATLLRPRLTSMARFYARKTYLDFDDLLQEAWCAVFEALPQTNLTIGQPEEYLMRRARWAVLDYLKWSVRRQMDPLEDWNEGSGPDTPASDTVTQVTVEKLARALTPIQQNIVKLLLDGETCTSAAQSLGCTTANVSYHLGQVRRQMAETFA